LHPLKVKCLVDKNEHTFLKKEFNVYTLKKNKKLNEIFLKIKMIKYDLWGIVLFVKLLMKLYMKVRHMDSINKPI